MEAMQPHPPTEINTPEKPEPILIQGPDGHIFHIDAPLQPYDSTPEAPQAGIDLEPSGGFVDRWSDISSTAAEQTAKSPETDDSKELGDLIPKKGLIAAAAGALAASYALSKGFESEVLRPHAETLVLRAGDRVRETSDLAGMALFGGLLGARRQRKGADRHYRRQVAEKSRSVLEPKSTYDPLANFDVAHRTRKLEGGQSRERVLADGTVERYGFAGDISREVNPTPDQALNPTSTRDKMRAMKANLQVDKITKLHLEKEKYQNLYGHHIGDPEEAEDIIRNGRYTFFQRKAIRRASKTVRGYEKTIAKTERKLHRQASK